MATKYVVLSQEEIQKASPTYNPVKLSELVCKQLARKLKADKKYAANIDDDTVTATLVSLIEDALVVQLKKLKDAPTALELYTDTAWYSSESNLLLKLSCTGPLNGKPQRIDVDWKQVKGDLKDAGKQADREAKLGMKRWTVLSHPDIWPRVKSKMSKEAAEGFNCSGIPVEVEITDLDVLEALSKNANPLLLQKVKDKADFGGLIDAVAELCEMTYEGYQEDEGKKARLEAKLEDDIDALIIESAQEATAEILASARARADRKKYIIKSAFKMVLNVTSTVAGVGGVVAGGLTGGLSAIYGAVQAVQAAVKTIRDIRALAAEAEEVQEEYVETVAVVKKRYADAGRTRVGVQEVGSELLSAFLTENVVASISTCRRLLEQWKDKNNGLVTRSESTSKGLDRALDQAAKARKAFEKLDKEANANKGDVSPATLKQGKALIQQIDRLEESISETLEKVIALAERAEASVKAQAAEAAAFAPLGEKQPVWSRITATLVVLGKSVADFKAGASLESLGDQLDTANDLVGLASDLKDAADDLKETYDNLNGRR